MFEVLVPQRVNIRSGLLKGMCIDWCPHCFCGCLRQLSVFHFCACHIRGQVKPTIIFIDQICLKEPKEMAKGYDDDFLRKPWMDIRLAKYFQLVLLWMEEILHQLVDGLSHDYPMKFTLSHIYTNWCRISQPSTVCS